MALYVATTAPRYSASVLNSATLDWFLLLQATAALPSEKHKSGCRPEVAGVSGPIGIGVVNKLFGYTGPIQQPSSLSAANILEYLVRELKVLHGRMRH